MSNLAPEIRPVPTLREARQPRLALLVFSKWVLSVARLVRNRSQDRPTDPEVPDPFHLEVSAGRAVANMLASPRLDGIRTCLRVAIVSRRFALAAMPRFPLIGIGLAPLSPGRLSSHWSCAASVCCRASRQTSAIGRTASNPPLGKLRSKTDPPCAWMMDRAIARPRPTPPVSRLREGSNRTKGSKTASS